MPTFKQYIIGFILSIVFTLAAYFAVVNKMSNALIIILILAIAQLIIQLVFFLHVGQEEKPMWNLTTLVSTFGIIFILVLGTLWIMNHLNYNMTPEYMKGKMMMDEGMNMHGEGMGK